MVQWLSYKIKSSVNIPVISGAPLYPQTEELQNYGARFFSLCVIFCLESLLIPSILNVVFISLSHSIQLISWWSWWSWWPHHGQAGNAWCYLWNGRHNGRFLQVRRHLQKPSFSSLCACFSNVKKCPAEDYYKGQYF